MVFTGIYSGILLLKLNVTREANCLRKEESLKNNIKHKYGYSTPESQTFCIMKHSSIKILIIYAMPAPA